jgi:hypothetical protein
METTPICPECGAVWGGGKTCRDDFDQMLAWEYEDLARFGAVHHLMVLCYHLQHPSLYSPEGLSYGRQLLVDFIERGVTPSEVHQRNRERVDSSSRAWKIRGTPASHGDYEHPVAWRMTAADVIAGGTEHYCDNVRAWARAVLDDLKASGNLPEG